MFNIKKHQNIILIFGFIFIMNLSLVAQISPSHTINEDYTTYQSEEKKVYPYNSKPEYKSTAISTTTIAKDSIQNNSQTATSNTVISSVSMQDDLLKLNKVKKDALVYPHPSCLLIIESMIGVQADALKLSMLADTATRDFMQYMVGKSSDLNKDLISTNFERIGLAHTMNLAMEIKKQTDSYVISAAATHSTYTNIPHNDDITWTNIQDYIYCCLDSIAHSMLAAKNMYEYYVNTCEEKSMIELMIKRDFNNYAREQMKDERIKELIFMLLKNDENYQYAIKEIQNIQQDGLSSANAQTTTVSKTVTTTDSIENTPSINSNQNAGEVKKITRTEKSITTTKTQEELPY